tara:strand:- start:1423 stop:1596 length:174 start_codon:yes stop_codon:yes gene_type:complete
MMVNLEEVLAEIDYNFGDKTLQDADQEYHQKAAEEEQRWDAEKDAFYAKLLGGKNGL